MGKYTSSEVDLERDQTYAINVICQKEWHGSSSPLQRRQLTTFKREMCGIGKRVEGMDNVPEDEGTKMGGPS